MRVARTVSRVRVAMIASMIATAAVPLPMSSMTAMPMAAMPLPMSSVALRARPIPHAQVLPVMCTVMTACVRASLLSIC